MKNTDTDLSFRRCCSVAEEKGKQKCAVVMVEGEQGDEAEAFIVSVVDIFRDGQGGDILFAGTTLWSKTQLTATATSSLSECFQGRRIPGMMHVNSDARKQTERDSMFAAWAEELTKDANGRELYEDMTIHIYPAESIIDTVCVYGPTTPLSEVEHNTEDDGAQVYFRSKRFASQYLPRRNWSFRVKHWEKETYEFCH
jgi:hypothetical protein